MTFCNTFFFKYLSYHILSDHISYFHPVDPYRITKSIWIWKYSHLLKESRSESQYKSVQQLYLLVVVKYLRF